MRIAVTSFALVGTMACAAPCVAGSATFKLLETWSTFDVTIDQFGRTLVLTGGATYSYGDMYIYEADADAYTYIGPGPARGFSADGTTVVGSHDATDGWPEAATWTDSAGWELLGGIGGQCDVSRSNGYAVSGDGSVVVGSAYNADCSAAAVVWTAEDGMQPLEQLALPYAPFERATVVSDDGQVIAGFAQGMHNRSPAIWNAADRSGSFIDVEAEGEFTAISPDGRILAGRYFDLAMFEAGYPGFMPCYWTEETGIGILPIVEGTDGGFVRGVSASGRTFVGSMGGGLPVGAMVIRPEWGAVALDEKLIELGVTNLGDAFLVNAWAVSDDGTVVVGWAVLEIDGIFQRRGFVATLPEEQPVLCNEDLDGDGQIGFADLTQLLGAWGPCAACPEDFDGDGQVGFTDLTQLLGTWGPCA